MRRTKLAEPNDLLLMANGLQDMDSNGLVALSPHLGMTKKQKIKFPKLLTKKQQAIQLSREMSQFNAEFQQKFTDAKYQDD